MSLVLGKIHYWLYSQVKTVEEREVEVVSAFKENYNVSEMEKLVIKVREEYGALKEDDSLEELIGDSQIHPWLEGAITTAQTREAAIVKELMSQYDDKELLLEIYKANGEKMATKVVEKQDDDSLEAAFELLKNTLLQRMPCDRLSAVVDNNPDKIVWRHDIKLHTEFWEEVGVSIELMHELYTNWIKGFMATINPEIKHQRNISQDQYEDIFTL
ncbi:hypothetical protein JCM16358_01630 [Halanaerocella petrolearia]